MSDNLSLKAIPHLQDILFGLFPAGRIEGFEFCIGDFRGNKGDSLKINLRTGVWAEFAGNEKGGNIMGVIEHALSIPYAEACVWLEKRLGIEPEKKQQVARDGTQFIIPARESAPSIVHPSHGAPTSIYEYRNQKNELVNYICRFDMPDGSKQFTPYSLTTEGWKWKQIPENRPLYRGEHLTNPAKQVIIVEGEKAANAAAAALPSVVVVTWSGGSKAVAKTDWSPLAGYEKVAIWPDNDEPGKTAADQIAKILLDLQVKKISVAEIPSSHEKGWDAADAVAESVDIVAFLKANLRERKPATPLPPPVADIWNPPAGGDAPIDTRDEPYIPLGHNHGEFFYYSHLAKQVVTLNAAAHTKLNLFKLADENYWKMTYPTGKGNSNFAVDTAASSLMQQCYRKGIYDVKKVRGRGAWWDDGRMVLHLGDHLIVDGMARDIFLESDFIYESGADLPEPKNKPLARDELEAYVELAKMFNWRDPMSAYFLMGWCVLAPICGILKWRPHVWLTGPKGSGKSWIMENFIGGTLGNLGLYVLSATTAAGIRGLVGHDALPVIFDEAEAEENAGKVRIQEILELMRQSSSRTAASIVKGTAFGGSMNFRVQSSFALASIGDSLKHGADESRVNVLQLYSSENRAGAQEKFDTILEKMAGLPKDFGTRLFARSIGLVEVINHNAEIFSRAGARILGSSRAGDQYGALLAGAYTLFTDKKIDDAEAIKFMSRHNFADHYKPANVEHRCYDKLMSIVLTVPNEARPVERSIGEMVDCLVNSHADLELKLSIIEEFLARRGIKVLDGHVVIANNHPELEKMLSSTPWSNNWSKIMQQMEGVDTMGGRIISFPGGIKQRVTRILKGEPPTEIRA